MRSANLLRPPAASTALLIASMPRMVKHCFGHSQALPADDPDSDNCCVETATKILAAMTAEKARRPAGPARLYCIAHYRRPAVD